MFNDNLQLNESQPSLIQFPSIVSPYFAMLGPKLTKNGFVKGSAVCTGGGLLALFIIHAMPGDQGIGPITSSEINNSIKQSVRLAVLNCEDFPKDKQPTIIFPLICGGILRKRLQNITNLAELIMTTAINTNDESLSTLNLMFVDFGKNTDFADEYDRNKEFYKKAGYRIEVKNGDIFEIIKNNPQQYILVNPYHSNLDKSYGQFLSNSGLSKSIINKLNQYNVILSNNQVKTAAECIYNYISNKHEVLNTHAADKALEYLNPRFEKITFLGGVYNFIKDTYLKIIDAFIAIFTFICNTVFSQTTENTNDDPQVNKENKSEMSTVSRKESQDSYDSNKSDDCNMEKIYQSFPKNEVIMPHFSHNSRSNFDDSQQSRQYPRYLDQHDDTPLDNMDRIGDSIPGEDLLSDFKELINKNSLRIP